MESEEIREEFSPLLDGELPPEQREIVEARLAEDADLLRELEGLKRVDDLFRKLPSQHTPPDFEERVQTALRPKVLRLSRGRLTPRRLWPTLAAAMLLLVSGAALVMMSQNRGRFDMASAPKAESSAYPADTQADTLDEAADAEAPLADTYGMAHKKGLPKRRMAAKPEAQSTINAEPPVPLMMAAPSPKPAAQAKTVPADPAPKASEGAIAEVAPRERKMAAVARRSTAAKRLAGGMEPAEEPTLGFNASAGGSRGVASESVPPPPALAEGVSMADDENASATPAPFAGGVHAEGKSLGVKAKDPLPQPTPKKQALARGVVAEELKSEAAELKDLEVAGAAGPAKSPEAGVSSAPAAPARKVAATPPITTPKDTTPKVVASRTFEWREDTWVEKGYKGEKTTLLKRGAKSFSDFFKKHKKLEKIPALGTRVIFRLDKTWFLLSSSEESK